MEMEMNERVLPSCEREESPQWTRPTRSGNANDRFGVRRNVNGNKKRTPPQL